MPKSLPRSIVNIGSQVKLMRPGESLDFAVENAAAVRVGVQNARILLGKVMFTKLIKNEGEPIIRVYCWS